MIDHFTGKTVQEIDGQNLTRASSRNLPIYLKHRLDEVDLMMFSVHSRMQLDDMRACLQVEHVQVCRPAVVHLATLKFHALVVHDV